MIDTFTNTFGLPENSVKLAGGVEASQLLVYLLLVF